VHDHSQVSIYFRSTNKPVNRVSVSVLLPFRLYSQFIPKHTFSNRPSESTTTPSVSIPSFLLRTFSLILIVPLIAVTVRAGDKKVPVNVDTVKTVLEFKVETPINSDPSNPFKEAIQATELNIPHERQKLIYSGRVLKYSSTCIDLVNVSEMMNLSRSMVFKMAKRCIVL